VTTGDQVVFGAPTPVDVPSGELTALPLVQQQASPHVRYQDGDGVIFTSDGWYEVLLRVDWDPEDTAGTRFAHTKIPGQEPLHSEAIDASVLARISEGRQLLRGNSVFGPDRTTSLVLEVWHDSDRSVRITYAELVVRELRVPWPRD
jgi:hypothetical protein